MLFPVMPTLVTTADEISVLGFDSTPEIAFVLFRTLGFDYVTVGSDHTDRTVETQSVVLSSSAEPRHGKECASNCRSRGSPHHYTTNNQTPYPHLHLDNTT